MDNEYLHSIAASPYVEEGFLSHARATGAGLRQRLQNISPSEDPYHTPFYAQLMSYYKGFVNDAKSILSEFAEGPTSPAERLKKMNLTPEERTLVDSLVNLYDQFIPRMFPAGTNPAAKPGMLRGLTPSNASYDQATKHNVREAWFGRKGAQSTGQAGQIINKYANDLKGVYDKFLKNIQRLFPTSPKEMLSKEFKKNVGDPKITKSVESVENVLKSLPQPTPEKEVDPKTGKPVAQPTATNGGVPTTPVSGGADATSQNPDKDSLALIVERVMEIIIDAVSSDERSKDWMTGKLPTNWQQPPVTKEPSASDKTSPPTKTIDPKKSSATQDDYSIEEGNEPHPQPDDYEQGDEGGEEEEEEDESPGEFLYNFHSRANKHKGGHYNIDVVPSNKSLLTLTLPNGKTKELGVIWSVKTKTENNIYVKHRHVENTAPSNPPIKEVDGEADGEEFEVTHLFKFYDHQVSPRNQSEKFEVKNLISKAHPSKGDVLAGANPKILEKINSLTDPLFRSFYATTSRKHMEFSSQRLNITMTKKGQVLRIKRDGQHEDVPDDEIELHVQSKDINERKKWILTLEKKGWFKLHGIDVPNWKDEPSDAPLIPTGSGGNNPSNSTKVGDIAAASEAVQMLQATGNKTQTAIKLVQAVVDKEGNGLTAQEYYKKASYNPTITKPLGDKVSQPAGAPPSAANITAPVSKPAGKEPASTTPSAPVSTAGGKPDSPGGDPQKPVDNPISPEDNEIADINGTYYVNKSGNPIPGKKKGKPLVVGQESPEQLEKIKANRKLHKKYKALSDLNEIINPYQPTNFL